MRRLKNFGLTHKKEEFHYGSVLQIPLFKKLPFGLPNNHSQSTAIIFLLTAAT